MGLFCSFTNDDVKHQNSDCIVYVSFLQLVCDTVVTLIKLKPQERRRSDPLATVVLTSGPFRRFDTPSVSPQSR